MLPFMVRLGVVDSWSGWSLSTNTNRIISNSGVWSFEGVGMAHIVLAGLLFLPSLWHGTYWDLDVVPGWTVRPSFGIYRALRIGNIETVLASSIAVVAW